MAALAACRKPTTNSASVSSGATPAATPGSPPAFGTAPEVGPVVSPATFAEAEKLMQFNLSPSEREQAAGNWRRSMAPLYERRTGPRKFDPPSSWRQLRNGILYCRDNRSARDAIDSSERKTKRCLFLPATRTSPLRRYGNSRVGWKRDS